MDKLSLGANARSGLAALAFLGSVAAGGAQSFTKIAPTPTQAGVWSTYFVDANRGFVAGAKNAFYRTLDGGTTWTQISLSGFQSDPLYNVTFLDSNVGLASGNSSGLGPDIFRTTDGGATWAQVTVFPLGGSWYHQDYVSTTVGFMGSNGGLVRSTDSGATWQLRSGYPDCPNMTGMDFIDANVGLATGGLPTFETGIFKTTDGGVTWQNVQAGAGDDVVFLTPTTAVAIVDNAAYRSTNTGSTWAQVSAPISTGLIDIERTGPTSLVGVSGSGDIWQSADSGTTWSQRWIGEGDLPGNWSVRFRDSLNGVVSGVRGLLYASSDGGLTWTRLNRGAAFEGNGLVALSNDTIVMAGHHGFAQRLTVGGAWNLALIDPPTFGRDTSFSALSSVGDFVYAVGHWGSMARSLDGGLTWQNLAGVVSMDFYANDVLFTSAQNGWLTGWDYSVARQESYKTVDGGMSWQVLSNGNYPGVAIDVIGQNVWIQSGARTNWRSTDGGATFVAGELPYNSGSAPSVADISYATSSLGYACGWDGYLVKTTDGGSTWTQLGSMIVNTTYLGVLATGGELWVCGGTRGGGNAFVKRSMDGGVTWQTWTFGGQYTTPYRMARSASRLFVTGYNGETWMLDGLGVGASTLTVQSANPNSGVTMSVWTADNSGLRNGVTPFTRTYGPTRTASVTAPSSAGAQRFDHWERDGVAVGVNRTINVDMAASHTIKAVYLPGRTVTVGSQNPVSGVPITVWTADKDGLRDGTTQFVRTYTQGSTAAFTAPALQGSNYFLRWDLDGAPWQSTGTVSLPLGASNRTLIAVYATGAQLTVEGSVPVPITVWTTDRAGRRDGTTSFNRVYAIGTTAALTAPAAASGKPFLRWEKDGAAVPGLQRTIKVPMDASHTIRAVYSP